MRELILKYAVMNAVEHDGKAEVQAVLKKVIGEKPEMKERIKEVVEEVKEVVEEVNSWEVEEQKRRFEEMGIKIEKKEFVAGLPELPNAEIGKVVMRLAPYPSGPLHIGNARMVILNDEYVKRYRGKLFLVIDDTIGSEEKFIIPEAYEMILDGLKWLGVKYNKVFYKSDRLKFFYRVAEDYIRRGIAYVCECDVETLRKNRTRGIECKHRRQSVGENLRKWKEMVNGKYREGKAVLRLKTDMQDPNPAFRDRVLFRIVGRKHPRVGRKYRAWPLLEASWAADDLSLKVTHILRGKDLVMEDLVEKFIWEKMRVKNTPMFVHYGMLNIKEAKLSKTAARKAIEAGIYSGWDDPRTWSLQSLRKRGIQPEAIRRFVVAMGLSEADVSVPAEILYAENRKLIDPIANRYFAILEPVKISIENAPMVKNVEAPLHPDFPRRGKRKIAVDVKNIYIEKSDLKNHGGREIRLMDLFNVKLGKKAEFTSKEMRMEMQKIQWVSEPNVKIRMVMPDGSTASGIVEPDIKSVKIGEIVQFIRMGFARLDKKEKGVFVFYFSHK
jgi:glutamyl-tRNA synthetase